MEVIYLSCGLVLGCLIFFLGAVFAFKFRKEQEGIGISAAKQKLKLHDAQDFKSSTKKTVYLTPEHEDKIKSKQKNEIEDLDEEC